MTFSSKLVLADARKLNGCVRFLDDGRRLLYSFN